MSDKPQNRRIAGEPNGGATRFKPGVSGNPGGRPKTRLLSEAFRNRLGEVDPSSGKTNAEIIADTLTERAKIGDVKAAAEIADRCEGKAPQRLDVVSVQIRASWDRLSDDELLAYAERGELPDWFELPALDCDEDKP